MCIEIGLTKCLVKISNLLISFGRNLNSMRMNKIVLFLLMISIFACSQNEGTTDEEKNEEKVERFDWLLGQWQRVNEKEGQQTYENWTRISETEYLGEGFTMQEQDTVWMEYIRLVKNASNWTFEVRGSNETKATIFKLSEFDSISFSCVNPENEFPKFIKYTTNGKGLKATISGGKMEVFFDFVRFEH